MLSRQHARLFTRPLRAAEKNVGGHPADYIYDAWGNVSNELNNVCAPVCIDTDYLYLDGQLVAEYKEGLTYFVHRDHLGSTRLVTNYPSQSVAQNLDYLPFGELNSTDSGTSTHKFTGKERDTESNLDYFDARHNSSSLARFMSPDQGAFHFGNPLSLNRYVYALDNPLRFIDPNGRDPQETITGLWQIWNQLRDDIGRPLPYVTVNDLSAITSRSSANAGTVVPEMILGSTMMVGGAVLLSRGSPVGLGVLGLGAYFGYSGYQSFKQGSLKAATDLSNSLAIFKFEQQIAKQLSEINPMSVRDFTPEQLSEAKLAAQSILRTGFLPAEIYEQVVNTIAIIEAEFKRREEEAKKKDKKRDDCKEQEKINCP